MTGCTTPSSNASNHWRIESVGPRISYHFFGYDGTKDGTGTDFANREATSAMKTVRRRFVGVNPDNPLTADM